MSIKMNNIIKPFLEEPEKEFHVRQIAKLVKKSPTTISKILKGAEKRGILKSEKKLNHLLFRADSESKEYKNEKLSYNLDLIEGSGVLDCLEKEFNNPEAITLFGSFAKAEDTPASDIDLLVISPLKKELDLRRFEKKLGHNVQLFVHSKKDIEKMKSTNKELLNKWVNGITLRGFLEVFE